MSQAAKLAVSIALAALATLHPAGAVPPSGATCIASPSSKDPFAEGKEQAARELAEKQLLWGASNEWGMSKVLNEKAAAKQQRETHLHAVSAIMGFLGRVEGKDHEWAPENVTEAAGILRDLGLDVWEVRSFVGDGKGGKLHNAFLSRVTRLLTGETLMPFPLTEDDEYWRDFITNTLDQRLRYFEDREKAASGYLSGLAGRVQGDVSPFPFLFTYGAKHELSYTQAARLMTEALNAPAAQKGIGAGVQWAWQDSMFIGDRETTTDLTDEGRKVFDALPLNAVFYHPNGRACTKVSLTHSQFLQQIWPSEDKKACLKSIADRTGVFTSSAITLL
jgi:hypothetical protein